MKRYLITYITPSGTYSGENLPVPTPEEAKAGTQAWIDWARSCGTQLKDFGAPVLSAVTINALGETITTSPITGYSIIEAENIDEAKKLFSNHPHLGKRAEWTINIHELMAIPQP